MLAVQELAPSQLKVKDSTLESIPRLNSEDLENRHDKVLAINNLISLLVLCETILATF